MSSHTDLISVTNSGNHSWHLQLLGGSQPAARLGLRLSIVMCFPPRNMVLGGHRGSRVVFKFSCVSGRLHHASFPSHSCLGLKIRGDSLVSFHISQSPLSPLSHVPGANTTRGMRSIQRTSGGRPSLPRSPQSSSPPCTHLESPISPTVQLVTGEVQEVE